MTDDMLEQAARAAYEQMFEGDFPEGGIEHDLWLNVARAARAAPAPAADREGLANFVANAISRSSQQHVPVGYRVADALIAAGQVGGTDAQQRVDAALAVLADRHEDWCPGKLHADCCGKDCECGYGEIRRALTAQETPHA